MKTLPAYVQERIDHGYTFNISDAVSEGWRLITKQPLLFVGAVVLYFIANIMSGMIPLVGSMVSYIIITPCFVGGVILVCIKLDREEQITFNHFLEGFNHLQELAIAALLSLLLMAVSAIPMIMLIGVQFITLLMSNGDTGAIENELMGINFGLVMLSSLIVLYAAVALGWVYHFVLVYNLQAWDAIVASFKLVNKQVLWLVLFYILVGIIVFLGILALGVGMLFTYPLGLCIIYAAFKQASGYNPVDTPEDDDILSHLIDG